MPARIGNNYFAITARGPGNNVVWCFKGPDDMAISNIKTQKSIARCNKKFFKTKQGHCGSGAHSSVRSDAARCRRAAGADERFRSRLSGFLFSGLTLIPSDTLLRARPQNVPWQRSSGGVATVRFQHILQLEGDCRIWGTQGHEEKGLRLSETLDFKHSAVACLERTKKKWPKWSFESNFVPLALVNPITQHFHPSTGEQVCAKTLDNASSEICCRIVCSPHQHRKQKRALHHIGTMWQHPVNRPSVSIPNCRIKLVWQVSRE